MWYILTHTYYTVTVSVQVSPSPWPINGHLHSPSHVRLTFNTVPASWHKQELQNRSCTSCIGRSGCKLCAFFHLQRNMTDLAHTRTAIYSINKVNACNHYLVIQRRYTYAILNRQLLFASTERSPIYQDMREHFMQLCLMCILSLKAI